MAQQAACANCAAPLGSALGPGNTPPFTGAFFDSQTNAYYCSSGCAERARGSQTITTSAWSG
jgi:hypothetical protein